MFKHLNNLLIKIFLTIFIIGASIPAHSEESKTKRKAKMKRLQSSGHVDDAASILEDMFNS